MPELAISSAGKETIPNLGSLVVIPFLAHLAKVVFFARKFFAAMRLGFQENRTENSSRKPEKIGSGRIPSAYHSQEDET